MLTITCIHNNRPLDVDNIPKPVIDALKGLVFTDDRQITDMLCRKRQLLDLLIAHKPGESAESLGESVAVIVRAKKAQRKSKDIGELAVLLRNNPGWKFSLALVETDEQLALPGNSIPFNREDIRRCSAEAERLLASVSPHAALLMAWAAADATNQTAGKRRADHTGKSPGARLRRQP